MNTTAPGPNLPTLAQIRATAAALAPYVVRTPVHHWQGRGLEARLGDTAVWLKLELLQNSGSFKARGVVANLRAMSGEELRRGVTAMSAGNHAIAVAWGAARFGISAKVVMQASANPARVALARAYGAEVLIAADGPTGFALAEKIAREEGRRFIHPFADPATALGAASVGLEICEQLPDLDAVVIAIGGGGLAGGAARAIKLLRPQCQVFGVEPEGADSMYRSFVAGSAQRLERVDTIADSLAPPMTVPYTYELCRASIDEIVRVADEEICRAMALLFSEVKLAVEPGGAAATAGLLFHLGGRLRGRKIGVVVCGSNIDIGSFSTLVRRGEAANQISLQPQA